jgi:circadian clock protein KaiC
VTASPTSPDNGRPGLIRRLPTGVVGLDAVLGGGVPELSFNLIAGGPGSGKTTLAQQLLFANATRERPGIYFTVLGEPTLKMIRYQRQFAFFDAARVGRDVHLLNLSAEAMAGELDAVLARIVAELERHTPGVVVVDSFRTLGPHGAAADPAALAGLEHFVQRLALQLTSWETTSFLISEYADDEQRHPVFTVADGIVWLSQVADRNSVVRKLQVMKVRGQAFMPGLHTVRITGAGLEVFPRIPEQHADRRPAAPRRLPTGVPGLDDMMGGGIPAGDAVLLAGPTGTGKTTFATQFVAAGAAAGDAAVIAVFEEYPAAYVARARTLGVDLGAMIEAGTLRIIYLRPLDLSVDETLAEILAAVDAVRATRVVIDSVSGFEVALAPAFREDFRESFYRLVGALTATGVTVLMTNEVAGAPSDAGFTGERVSFLTDDIVVQRYVELEGQLRTVLAVVKMRGSAHSRDLREYTLTPQGAVVGESMRAYRGILTGAPERSVVASARERAGLAGSEAAVLDALVRLGGASAGALGTRTGVPPEEMARALERLVALGYAAPAGQGDDGPAYRAVARPSGS